MTWHCAHSISLVHIIWIYAGSKSFEKKQQLRWVRSFWMYRVQFMLSRKQCCVRAIQTAIKIPHRNVIKRKSCCHVRHVTVVVACSRWSMQLRLRSISLNVNLRILNEHSSYLISIVRPATEFHLAMLIIKWEPCDVYFTCTLKNTRWYVQTTAITFNYDICMVGAVKSFISTVNKW